MQNQNTLSITKIVIFIAFICAALTTSIFIFYARHKPTQATTLSAEHGSVFPAGREIKTFELMSASGEKFSTKNFLNHWTLLFFGFTHCSNVCPTTLDMLNKAYEKLHPSYPNLQVVLISLDPNRDNPETIAKYTHSFNPDFIGVTGKIQEIRKLQSQLGIFSAPDPSATGNNYQLQHTSSILLINPAGKWAGVFSFGMKPAEFAEAFQESMKSAAVG